MSVYEKISGFADEISQDFDQQLKTVTDLGMKYNLHPQRRAQGHCRLHPRGSAHRSSAEAAGRRRGRF